MAKKDSNTTMIETNKETIKKVSSKVHEELLNTSHLFIDETVATLTRMQRITGKVIKKSEPLLEKQIEITFDAVDALKGQANKGGKRALKLLGLTKQYNKLTNTISEKVSEIPSTEEIIDSAKEMVATAKSDVEDTLNKATESIKSVTSFGDADVAKKATTIEKKVAAKTKAVKKTVKKTVAKAKTAAKATKSTPVKTTAKAKTIAKKATSSVKPTAKKVVSTAKKVTTPAKAKLATSTKKATTAKAKVATAKKTTTAKTVAKKTVTAKVVTPNYEVMKIKGIGASLAGIMADNGIKTIKELQNATPTALKVIATKAGNRYKSFDTNKWIDAAKAI